MHVQDSVWVERCLQQRLFPRSLHHYRESISTDCNWTGELLDSQNGNFGLLAGTITLLQWGGIGQRESQASTENVESFDLHGEDVS